MLGENVKDPKGYKNAIKFQLVQFSILETDICKLGTHNCTTHTTCVTTATAFECQCKDGYVMKNKICTKKTDDDDDDDDSKFMFVQLNENKKRRVQITELLALVLRISLLCVITKVAPVSIIYMLVKYCVKRVYNTE